MTMLLKNSQQVLQFVLRDALADKVKEAAKQERVIRRSSSCHYQRMIMIDIASDEKLTLTQ